MVLVDARNSSGAQACPRDSWGVRDKPACIEPWRVESVGSLRNKGQRDRSFTSLR
jgi:hypothetical protein